MKIGNRKLNVLLAAPWDRRHYIAIWNMVRLYPNFAQNIWSYISARGEYPASISVHTPEGLVCATLYSHHDLLTVNEIFCRCDYYAEESVGAIVDLGSNIGISALYFLSRNKTSRCYLFEPDPKNLLRMKNNLAGYSQRIEIHEVAVAATEGLVHFGIEPTGRYGGIGVRTSEHIEVQCKNINSILERILMREELIDVLKIDTEGVEVTTVSAINPEYLKRIKTIYIEAEPHLRLHSELFSQKQYGSICVLKNRSL